MNELPQVYETNPNFTGRILSIEQIEKMVTVIIAEDDQEDPNFVSHFLLHKIDGTWVIISKAAYGKLDEK